MSLPASLQRVTRLLDERARQLENEVGAARARRENNLRDAHDPHDVKDRKDEANARALEATADAEVERDLAELRAIAFARERIADGCYGRCTDCGADIDPNRLLAQPTAARCIVCQTEAERRPRGTARG